MRLYAMRESIREQGLSNVTINNQNTMRNYKKLPNCRI